ncbi:MAG: hypothetical protein LBV07_04940 [Syntrophobacterales bacterium]|jgi:hypothetical protein|nr:hypothetical protein [Syntrophobacterales bacterium]
MGLGLTMWFPLNGQGANKERYQNYFQHLSSIVPSWKTNSFFDDKGFRVKLVPFEEDVYGTWEEERLCISAKTNSAGPGYHAYLIDLLDGLGIAPVEVEDETGYYGNRDFVSLQEEMTKWLRGLSEQILKMSAGGKYKNLAVSLSIDCFPEDSGHLACCPLGYFEREFFAKAQKGKAGGAEFFIWWNQPQDAMFFKNTALNLIWCENNWLPPETELEHEIIAATLACLEKAYALEPGTDYPAAEWTELARLSRDELLEQKLHSRFGSSGEARLGYKQGFVTHNIYGWRVTANGKMHFDREEDGSLVWWDDVRTIRATAFSVELKEGADSESLLQSATRSEENCDPFTLRNPKIAASIQHDHIEENGEPLFQTRLTAALDDKLLILSLFYVHAADRDWAIKVSASVAR